jgi:hypothetical protein
MRTNSYHMLHARVVLRLQYTYTLKFKYSNYSAMLALRLANRHLNMKPSFFILNIGIYS